MKAKLSAEEIMSISRKIASEHLVDRHPRDTSAILADLTSMWLASFSGDDDDDTEQKRQRMLTRHITLVIKLTAIHDLMLKSRVPEETQH